MRNLERVLIYGALVVALAGHASAEDPAPWRYDPDPGVESTWRQVAATKAQAAKVAEQIERERKIRQPLSSRRMEASAALRAAAADLDAKRRRLASIKTWPMPKSK